LNVKKGAKVKRGDLIGHSGNSGLSTGPHLHYEVRHNGIALNPRNFIYDNVKLFDVVAQN
jgi:murein DD-endopeptidase MepM/ murein hydrolase activator NlpD